MTKVRVYEVARDLGIDNKALVLLFQSVGVSDVRNHMSAIGPEAVERVKRHLEKQKAQKGVEEHIRPTVVKRRAVVHAEPEPAPSKRPSPEAAPPRKRIAAPAEPVASEPASAPVPPREKPDRAVAPHAPEPIAPVLSGTSETIPEIPAAPVSVTEPVRMVETKAAEPPPEAPSPTPQPVERGSEQPVRPSSPPKTGIDVWEGRPGVPMPQAARGAPTPRRVQYDAKAGAAAAARRGTGAVSSRIGTRAMRHRGIGTLARQKGGGQPVTQERSAHKKVVRIQESIGLPGLAGKIGVKATEVLMKLISLGMSGVNINSTLD
ncbi:MAG TPA: translation initiation factor IF-2 N-terminal domain-containing protein, partial [Polyangiaceae bacterium]